MSTFGQSATVEAAQSAFRAADELQNKGDFRGALPLNRDLVKRYPKWPWAYFGLANAYTGLGQFEDARKNLRKAIGLKDTEPVFHARLADALARLDDLQGATEAIDAAIKLDPADTAHPVTKALILRRSGHTDRAHQLLEPLYDAGERDHRMVRIHASVLGALGRHEQGIEALEPLVEQTHADPIITATDLFVLTGLYDKAARYDDAWAAATRASDLSGKTYDPEAREKQFQTRAAAWTADRLPDLARSRSTSGKPVFIVGMPRSGTTLIEQIIAAHPRAYGAGELINIFAAVDEIATPTHEQPDLTAIVDALKPATLDRVARRILRDMEKQAPRGAKPERITDKLLLNFQHLGLIEQLFPNARVIHCHRHPLDVFVSCYLLDFEGPNAHAYTYDPEWFAHFYALYQKYIAHWHDASALPILDIAYEAVVADQESETRRILGFLDLPWDDACLDFHKAERTVNTASTEQVRRKIYTSSTHRYRNYDNHLGPVRSALRDHGVEIPGDD